MCRITFCGTFPNTEIGKVISGINKRDFLRGKLLLRPASNVDVSAMFFHTQTDTKNSSGSNAERTIASFIPSPNKDKTDLFNLVVNADLGSVRLVSSTGYLDRKIDTTAEFTSVYAGAPFRALVMPKPTSGAAYRQDMSQKITTQELRLESDDKGPLSWTADCSMALRKSSRL